jgi:hypothetical protein
MRHQRGPCVLSGLVVARRVLRCPAIARDTACHHALPACIATVRTTPMQYEAADPALSRPDVPDAVKRGIGSPIGEMNSHFHGLGALPACVSRPYHASGCW